MSSKVEEVLSPRGQFGILHRLLLEAKRQSVYVTPQLIKKLHQNLLHVLECSESSEVLYDETRSADEVAALVRAVDHFDDHLLPTVIDAIKAIRHCHSITEGIRALKGIPVIDQSRNHEELNALYSLLSKGGLPSLPLDANAAELPRRRQSSDLLPPESDKRPFYDHSVFMAGTPETTGDVCVPRSRSGILPLGSQGKVAASKWPYEDYHVLCERKGEGDGTTAEEKLIGDWVRLGFPSGHLWNDFRPLGVLGLRTLRFFAEGCRQEALRVLREREGTDEDARMRREWPPFAQRGLIATEWAFEFVQKGLADVLFYPVSGPTPEEEGVEVRIAPEMTESEFPFYVLSSLCLAEYSRDLLEERPGSLREAKETGEHTREKMERLLQSFLDTPALMGSPFFGGRVTGGMVEAPDPCALLRVRLAGCLAELSRQEGERGGGEGGAMSSIHGGACA